MKQTDIGPNYKHVSSVLDCYRNQIDRYERLDGADETRLKITVHPDSPRTAKQVEDWYWRYVGFSRIAAAQEALAEEWTEDRELARMQGY